MPKKVVIDRSKWLNAYTRYTLGPSFLLDQNGNMCCLGFVCVASGVPKEDLISKLTPLYIKTAPLALSDASVAKDIRGAKYTQLAKQAIEYNDESSLSKSGREKALRQIFAAEGTYELEFVGEYPHEHASSNT